MPESGETNRENESLRHFLEMVREAWPSGPDDDRFWDLVTEGAESIEVSRERQREVLSRTRLALALARNELTLGKYLTNLRTAGRFSRNTVARAARLSPDTVAELEADRCSVLSLQPKRLASLAVAVGAVKAAFMELAARAAGTPVIHGGLSRLTRLDRDSTLLESERAVRRTQVTRDGTRLRSFLAELSSAFDVERGRTRQA